MTALGAGVVLFTKNINKKLLDWMLGFAARVMIAASCWSLLSQRGGNTDIATMGAIIGFVVMMMLDVGLG